MRAQIRDDPRRATQRVPLICTKIRAARALIRWSEEEVARYTALSVTTIRRAELRASATVLTRANNQAIRHVLEQAGVEFIDAGGGGPGVRLRTPPAGK
jgi:transcriptional regulator with XRE-family HTH domain